MAGLFDSERASRAAPGSDTDGSSKWLDSIMTPDSGKAAGVGDGNTITNTYGRMSVPSPGPKGRGTLTPLMKNILTDDGSGDLRLPSAKPPATPRYPSR